MVKTKIGQLEALARGYRTAAGMNGREGCEARRDQEVARLFNECGWNHRRIAAKMGRAQSWVARPLLFGRFLAFMPSGHKSESPPDSLTEWRFRQAWSQARKQAHRKDTVLVWQPARFWALKHRRSTDSNPGIRIWPLEATCHRCCIWVGKDAFDGPVCLRLAYSRRLDEVLRFLGELGPAAQTPEPRCQRSSRAATPRARSDLGEKG